MTIQPRDITRQTLLRAIQIERRNSELYESLAQIFEGYDEGVQTMFRDMAEEERKHGADLRERYRARFGPVPLLATEPKEVIEAPDLPDAEALIFDSMTQEDALRTGLVAEEAAREFYQREVKHTADPELQELYRELGHFEDAHVRALLDKLVEMRRATTTSAR